jgi:hypothetical protein
MKRRELIAAIGAAATLPVAARAQQTDRVWRIAVIGAVSPLPEHLNAFREAIQQRGWSAPSRKNPIGDNNEVGDANAFLRRHLVDFLID